MVGKAVHDGGGGRAGKAREERRGEGGRREVRDGGREEKWAQLWVSPAPRYVTTPLQYPSSLLPPPSSLLLPPPHPHLVAPVGKLVDPGVLHDVDGVLLGGGQQDGVGGQVPVLKEGALKVCVWGRWGGWEVGWGRWVAGAGGVARIGTEKWGGVGLQSLQPREQDINRGIRGQQVGGVGWGWIGVGLVLDSCGWVAVGPHARIPHLCEFAWRSLCFPHV